MSRRPTRRALLAGAAAAALPLGRPGAARASGEERHGLSSFGDLNAPATPEKSVLLGRALLGAGDGTVSS